MERLYKFNEYNNNNQPYLSDFDYNKCKEGDFLYLITMNKSDNRFCKFEDNQKLLVKVVDKSDYLMAVVDKNGTRHTFLSEWFEETKDEFHGPSTLFNPDGIVIKFKSVDKKKLPFKTKFNNYFNKYLN